MSALLIIVIRLFGFFLGVLYIFSFFFLGSIQLWGTFCLFVAVLPLFAVCVFPQLFSFCVFFVCELSFFSFFAYLCGSFCLKVDLRSWICIHLHKYLPADSLAHLRQHVVAVCCHQQWHKQPSVGWCRLCFSGSISCRRAKFKCRKSWS